MLPADVDGAAYDWGVPGTACEGDDAVVQVVPAPAAAGLVDDGVVVAVGGCTVVIPYGEPMIPSPGSPPMVPHPPDAAGGWPCCSEEGADGSIIHE